MSDAGEPAGAAPALSVVIPTHDRREKVLRLLESIESSDFPAEEREVVVVADRCGDGTEEAVAARFPSVRIVVPDRPVYCQGGRVAGAAETRGEFVFFVDDDNIVDRRCLSTLVEVARARPGVGVLGPLMLEFPDGTGTWCAGATHERFGLVDYRARDGSELVADPSDPWVLEPCDFLPNAFLMRGDLARGSLALDAEVFPGAWGESDLGLRARRAGYEVRVAPAARVWHDHGYRRLSVRLLNRDRIVDQARARILIRRRHRDVFGSLAAYLLVTFPATTGYYLFRFARERRLREWGTAYANGTWHGLFDPIPPPPH